MSLSHRVADSAVCSVTPDVYLGELTTICEGIVRECSQQRYSWWPETADSRVCRPLASRWYEVIVRAVEPIHAAVGVSPAHVTLSERKAADAEGHESCDFIHVDRPAQAHPWGQQADLCWRRGSWGMTAEGLRVCFQGDRKV